MDDTPSSDHKGVTLPAALAPDTYEDRLSHEGRNQVLFNVNIVWNLFIFCCFVSACRLHARVDSSFAIQTAIATQLTSSAPLSQSPVASLAAAVSQLEGLASLADYAVNVSGVAEVGLHNRLIGGIRLAQSRYGVEPCPAGAEIYRNLGPHFDVDCIGDTESAASFGAGLDPALANDSLARAFRYRPPISTTRSTLTASLPFYAVLPYNGLLPSAVNALLRGMGWVDRLSKVVDLYLVLLNPGLNAVTEVSITYAIATGGQITVNLQALTLWFLPFTGGSSVAGLDVLVCVIVACLMLELAGRLAYGLHGIWVREPAARALFCRRRLLPCRVVSGVTLDAIAASLLLAIIILWSLFIRRISAAQASIEASAWSEDTYEADTLRMHEHVAGLSDLYSVVRTLALLNICALGIKIIFAFSFSTRLGSLHRAFGRALPDMGAAGLLVALVMAIFAVCGQILYGAAVPMWSDTLSAGLALFLELNGAWSRVAVQCAARATYHRGTFSLCRCTSRACPRYY